MVKKIRITLMKSIAGRLPRHVACAQGLGLRRRHHTVELADTPSIRGMVNKIAYLLKIEEIA